jgi:hypothetical protein
MYTIEYQNWVSGEHVFGWSAKGQVLYEITIEQPLTVKC